VVEEGGDIEEVVLAVAGVIGGGFLGGECVEECGDIEEVEFAVVGEVRGAGGGLGEEDADAGVAGVAQGEVWAAVAVEIAEGHGGADF